MYLVHKGNIPFEIRINGDSAGLFDIVLTEMCLIMSDWIYEKRFISNVLHICTHLDEAVMV